MNQLIGLLGVFVAPILPRKIFKKYRIDSPMFILAFVVLIVLSAALYFIYHAYFNAKYPKEAQPFLIIGFILGALTKISFESYIIWLLGRKATSQTFHFKTSFNLVLLSFLPTLLGITSVLFDSSINYALMYAIGNLWSLMISAMGLYFILKIEIKKILLIVGICYVILLLLKSILSGF